MLVGELILGKQVARSVREVGGVSWFRDFGHTCCSERQDLGQACRMPRQGWVALCDISISCTSVDRRQFGSSMLGRFDVGRAFSSGRQCVDCSVRRSGCWRPADLLNVPIRRSWLACECTSMYIE